MAKKKFKCYDCPAEFEAESREEILNILFDHYIKDHNEVITGASEEEKKAWMERFEKDWSNAPEVTT